jgi:hypothetical protein
MLNRLVCKVEIFFYGEWNCWMWWLDFFSLSYLLCTNSLSSLIPRITSVHYVLSAMNCTGKINRDQETNLPIMLSPTQMVWSGFWLKTNIKFEQRNSHQSDQGRREKKTHTPSNEEFVSSTLNNGLTAEHFSLCWMRRAGWGPKSRQNFQNAHNKHSLHIQTLHWCKWHIENFVLWKSTTSQKYKGRNNLAIAPLLLGFHFQPQAT